MVLRKFGRTGVDVPVIGQGTWMMEGTPEEEERAVSAMVLGLDLGLTHIDTAEMYGDGHVEELVAEAISGRRHEVFLTGKVLPYNASHAGTLRACENSLKRLRTDYFDLYLLHWEGPYPIGETMRAMERLVSQGLVRFIGVSNFELDRVREAQQTLRKVGLSCNQVLYHLEDRHIEKEIIPYCSEQGIAVVGYSPFGHGQFPSSLAKEGRLLDRLAKKYGRTPRQVALNFLTRLPDTFTIPKSADPVHVRENSGGAGWSMSEEDIAAIDRAFPIPEHSTLGII